MKEDMAEDRNLWRLEIYRQTALSSI
jgi:hypothetical protein